MSRRRSSVGDDASRCVVADCDRPRHRSSRSYCGAHRARLYRYGDPLGMPPPRRRRDLTGQRFGRLVAGEYSTIAQGWRCICDCGAQTTVRTWSLTSGSTTSCGDHDAHHQPTSYTTMHRHLRYELGPASDYPCARCGQPARHWSYRRRDASMRLDSPAGPWSTSTTDYEPLCVSHHKRADLAAIDEQTAREHGARPLWDDA